MTDVLLAIGTEKGLLLARSNDRASWQVSDLHFPMNGVYAVAIDTRTSTPRVLVSADSSHWGPSVLHSDDLGRTWAESDRNAIAFPGDTGAALVRVWALAPSPTEPDVVWAGSEPSALFRSEAVHTVLPHPVDPARITVAMSTGGVYRSSDAAKSFAPANFGVSAYFLPDPMPEFGQCVHKVARDSAAPEQMYLQNHRGVYRSDDDGTNWTSIADGLPCDFGFAMIAHPRRGDTAYSFPIESDGMRLPPDRVCRVFRTQDAGRSWEALSEGLPPAPYYGTVLRDAMCADDTEPTGIYFGTRDGDVYASPDEGEHWQLVAQHLPDVLCVRAAVVG
jgi:hypothetical protein